MSDALRALSDWVDATSIDFSGNTGNSGNKPEKPELFCYRSLSPTGNTGNSDGFPATGGVTGVTGQQQKPVTDKAPKTLDVTGVTGVTAKNDEGRRAATFAAAAEPPAQSDEWGLSRYTIRDFSRWYVDEADRHRDGDVILDQAALDRDLRARLADHGVFAEFISVEFERVMQAVFAVAAPRVAHIEAPSDTVVNLKPPERQNVGAWCGPVKCPVTSIAGVSECRDPKTPSG